MKYLIISIFAAFCAILPLQELNAQSFIPDGEELTYEVSFMGIKLGSIKMVYEGQMDYNGGDVSKFKAYIQSYDGIPFVDLYVIFESWLDPSLKFSNKFASTTKESGSWIYEQILFDYPNKNLEIKEWKDKELVKTTNINTARKWSDGMGLFYIARKLVHSGKNVSIPTVINRDTVHTSIYFVGDKEKVDIDAVSYPVRTVYFHGNANWTGVYGMTGKFEGWFSDDDARVPIKAKMKVYVGSVEIELKHWKRKGWGPPK